MTQAQLKAINSDANSILVSAAAGAGKTRVLTNRILRHVQGGTKLSRLLVVTFTEAASAEMKERIAKGLQELNYPSSLVQNADISTIHAFCRKLVKENYWKIDIDPAFRVGEQAELDEISKRVMRELFEQEYAQGSSDFLDLVEVYGGKMTDVRLDALVRKLHYFMESAPFPRDAAARYASFYPKNPDEVWRDGSKWVEILQNELVSSFDGALHGLQRAIELCNKPGGPQKYVDALQADKVMLSNIAQTIRKTPLVQIYDVVKNVSWARLARITAKDDVDEGLKEQVKRIRENSVKKRIDSVVSGVFFAPPSKMADDIVKAAPRVKALLDLVTSYGEKYAEEKRAENILDFSDLEHFAIQILYPHGPEDMTPDETYRSFYEVLVDEYQDSNEVQDLILSAVAKRKFMVGDVKQSIYRFRRADPSMFMSKFDVYLHDDTENERIDLSHNFRSRPEVLDAVNVIFSKICSKEVGDVPYDESARLVAGHSEYPEVKNNMQVEILDETDEDDEFGDEEMDASAVISETRMIAGCIHELMSTRKIYEDGSWRKCRLSDIVILTRGLSAIAGDVLAELKAQGIDAVSESNVSFFAQREIKTMRSFLRIVDNPRQDIDLIAVLNSPAYDFSSEEMFEISSIKGICSCGAIVSGHTGKCSACADVLRIDFGENTCDLYDKLVAYANIRSKASGFLHDLELLRQASVNLPISRLINLIFDISSYPGYVASMPYGDVRTANLRLLVQKAAEFEETGRAGLFQFNLYLDRLENTNKLSSSAGTQKSSDCVRLMTIHKSKGLEFPIVFVSFLAKQFNEQDVRSSVIMHPKYGIGPYYVDLSLRTRANTLARYSLAKLTHYQNMSEEMRCLYVAMTRAKDKLVLTGRVKSLEKSKQKWMDGVAGQVVPAYYLKSAKCYLDWLMPCLLTEQEALGPCHPSGFSVRVHTKSVVCDALANRSEEYDLPDSLQEVKAPKYIEPLSKTSFALPSKLSISEIKRLYNVSPDSTTATVEITPSFELPSFIKKEKKVSYAEIGRAIHVILEQIDYFAHTTHEKLSELVDYLVKNNYVAEEAALAVDCGQLLHFINSSLADRLRAADKVFRETPFVLAIQADRVFDVLNPRQKFAQQTFATPLERGIATPRFMNDLIGVAINPKEKILVHGIIDCYIVESRKIVLVDFKSDRIPQRVKPEDWAKTHALQLGIYKEALEKSTDMEVSEVLLYSFYLGREVRIS